MCLLCDRAIKGTDRYWWYCNFVCWTCRVQNGVDKSKTDKQDLKDEKSNKFYRSFQYMEKPSSSTVDDEKYTVKQPKMKHITRTCYRCNQPMVNVGFKFKTPKKTDIKQWKLLEKTWENQRKIVNGKEIYVGPKPVGFSLRSVMQKHNRV